MSAEPRAHHIRVQRTARYHTIGDPAAAAELWFALHGYAQLAERFVRKLAPLPGVAEGRRALVAPEALSRFYVERRVGGHGPDARVGASWMTRADREPEIRDYVDYLDAVAGAVLETRAPARPRVVVLGFSQGAETASRWVTYGRVAPDELVLWGGGLAEDLDIERAAMRLRGARVRVVIGDEDAWAKERGAATIERLGRSGVLVERIDYAGGHRIEPDVLRRFGPPAL